MFVHILSFKTHPAPEGSTTCAALSLTPHTPSLAHQLRSFYQPQRTPEGLFEVRFKPATGLTTPEPDVNPCLRNPNFHQSFSLPLRSDPAPRSEGIDLFSFADLFPIPGSLSDQTFFATTNPPHLPRYFPGACTL